MTTTAGRETEAMQRFDKIEAALDALRTQAETVKERVREVQVLHESARRRCEEIIAEWDRRIEQATSGPSFREQIRGKHTSTGANNHV